MESSWLIGSITLSSAATLTIDGNDQDVAAGSYYLYDPTASLSLIKQVENAIAAVVAGSTVYIGRDRKVRIDFNGNSTTIDIPLAIRAALGFTQSSYAAATSRTAERVSTLLWSPGWPETPIGAPVGTAGRVVYDRVMTASPTGQTFTVTLHHSSTLVSWNWLAVRQDRAWTTSALPGEYVDFFDRIIVRGKRMKLYSNMSEDDASSTAVTWVSPLGPYIVPEPDWEWYRRFNPNSDSIGANISIEDALLTSEYT